MDQFQKQADSSVGSLGEIDLGYLLPIGRASGLAALVADGFGEGFVFDYRRNAKSGTTVLGDSRRLAVVFYRVEIRV